ncbi:MAG: ATP-grasp domain-containing protein [Treponema sp.]|nr:ATP-grasp domain-containing protein [Treponema sp.]
MSDRYVFILGAGLMQKPAFEAAKKSGFKIICADANPKAVCVSYADKFFTVDLKDKEGLLSLAREYRDVLCAVFTAGTDFSSSVAYVSENTGLPGHSYEASKNASNKALMRSCFEKEGVPSPGFTKIRRSSIAEFISDGSAGLLSFPKVVKPCDNMGARGCRLVRGRSELLPSLEDAVRYSKSSSAILEDYMEGPEFSIDALIYDGTFTVTGFADRHIFFPPYFIETGHTMPSFSVDEKTKLSLIKAFARGAKSLGLTCGAAKADIKLTSSGPMLGEIAARLSGGYMSGWTYPYASGLDLTKEALLIAAGQKPESLLSSRVPLSVEDAGYEMYEVPCNAYSCERSWISIPGTVKKIYGLDKALASPFVKNVFPRAQEGDEVSFPRNNVQKCGNVISRAETLEDASSSAENAVSNIVLRLLTGSFETDIFLSGKELETEKSFPPSCFEAEKFSEELRAFEEKNPVLKKDLPLAEFLASSLPDDFLLLKDYNYRSVKKTALLFDEISPVHPELSSRKILSYLIRGGLQGLLYLSDTVAEKGKIY